MKDIPEKVVVGWREIVDLPEWHIHGLVAKADTGARSSAIDVASLEELDDERVRFEVVIDRDHPDRRQVIEADIVRRTCVRSSFGASHDRLFVVTTLRLAGHDVETEFGLVCRRNMLCRMLLGRKTLEHGFVVDPARRYAHGRKPRTARRRKKGIP